MDFVDKVGVISKLWIEFRNDGDFSAFMQYNDIGCPMAYMMSEGLINELNPVGEQLIEETFKMFLDLVNVTEEEIDSVLPEKNLGAILVFSHNKKNATATNQAVEEDEEVDPALLGRTWSDLR
jgi:hypothetical protein